MAWNHGWQGQQQWWQADDQNYGSSWSSSWGHEQPHDPWQKQWWHDSRNASWDQDNWQHGDAAAGQDGWGSQRRDSTEVWAPDTVDTGESRDDSRGEQLTDAPASEHPSMPMPNSVSSADRAGGSHVKAREPKTGKEVIPEWSGETPIRDYRRRVALFEASTGIDAEYRAGRLLEKLSGMAWQATETLSPEKLRTPNGVELLNHLQAELEPVEHLRVFGTLATFYKQFRRSRGQEFCSYDTDFRVQLRKLEEANAPLSGISKSYWFLECAAISDELRKQVIAASGGSYEYERLRAALIAIVPKIHRDTSDDKGNGSQSSSAKSSTNNNKKFFAQKKKGPSNRVNMVEDEAEESDVDHGDE